MLPPRDERIFFISYEKEFLLFFPLVRSLAQAIIDCVCLALNFKFPECDFAVF
jgi:hypothetical protein